MRNNIIVLDRLFRFLMAGFLIYTGSLGMNLWSILALYLLASSLTGHCALYGLVEKNHTLKTERFYLDQLPKNNPEPILVFCSEGTILFQNSASKNILPGIKSFFDLFDEDPMTIIKQEQFTRAVYTENGKTYQFEAKGIENHNHILTYGFNITDIIRSKEELHVASITDELTGLGNRRQLNHIIDTSDSTLILVVLDMVKFGEFNAFYGHRMGNLLLKSFANFLRNYEQAFEEKCELFRLQSNTFALLIYCKNSTACERDFTSRVHTLIDTIRRHTFTVEEITTLLDVRAGVAVNLDTNNTNKSAQMLMGEAEATLQEAKKRDVQYLFYDDIKDIKERYSENLYWSHKLKSLLIHQQSEARLVAFFQPIYHFKTKRIEKYEALVRIQEKESIIPPFKFLDAAKQLHLLPHLTIQMIEQTFQILQGRSIECSINVTTQDLEDDTVIEHLQMACKRYDIDPSRVVLEILEDEDIYQFIPKIQALKADGFKIAIDDFGVGYSNFQKLQQLDANYIKIDGSLVKNIATNPHDLNIIDSIVTYAKTIGAKTIAEFVADEMIFTLLEKAGVDYAQGYYIAPPSSKLLTESAQ